MATRIIIRPQTGSEQVLKAFLRSSGEGSRGGHVVGHTADGKPVYAKGTGRRKAIARLYLHARVHAIGRALDRDYAKAEQATDPITIERNYALVNAKVARLNHIRQKLGLTPISAYR